MIPTNSANQKGLSTVELIVTIVVAGMFIVTFYQLYTVIYSINAEGRHAAIADNLSYTYLLKYSTTNAPNIACNSSSDMTANSAATGISLEEGDITSETPELPAPVTYQVSALAPYGCNGANDFKPIKVETVVQYGPTDKQVKHSTLVKY